MNMIIKKSVLVLVMCSIVAFSMNAEIHAKGNDVGISPKSIQIYTNMSKIIKIKKPSSKVKWTTSNKKIASIIGIRGENNDTVIINTGKKAGKCKISAAVGEKVYSCTINVESDKKISRAKFAKLTQTKKQIKIKLILNNKSNSVLKYGDAFSVEKLKNGRWSKMNMNKNTAFSAIGYGIQPHKSAEKEYDLSNYYKRSAFTKGTYRIRIDSNYKSIYNYVIFSIN